MFIGDKEYTEYPHFNHFNGKKIVEEILKQVVSLYTHIQSASRIILSGDSAGALGAQNNGDRISLLLNELIEMPFTYKLVPDSGWF